MPRSVQRKAKYARIAAAVSRAPSTASIFTFCALKFAVICKYSIYKYYMYKSIETGRDGYRNQTSPSHISRTGQISDLI